MANPIHQFEITPYAEFHVAGIDLSFTNSSLWMVIGAIVSIVFFVVTSRSKSMVPGRMQALGEISYNFIGSMVKDNIGSHGKQYFPFIFTLFFFVLMGNILGLLPYAFTYTSHLAVTGLLAVLIFCMVIIIGLLNHGFKFFTLFIPAGAPWWLMPFIIPIEVVSFFVRPISLAVRLFANMMAGHILLKVIAGFAIGAASMGGLGVALGIIPVMINVIMYAFEALVAFIQAYVFAILACVYLKDTVELHH